MNSREFLPRNIASVRAQGFSEKELEHWVIDGGSQDGTVEYLESQRGVRFVSERDRGLSHAVNKGIHRARGEWVLWLNADDEFAPGALRRFLEVVDPDDRIVCGLQEVRAYDGQLEVVSKPWPYTSEALLNECVNIIQASTFVHREVYERVGGMDGMFRYAMDYEWMVRALKEFPCRRIDELLSIYHKRQGSITDIGIAGQSWEFLRVRRSHGCNPISVLEAHLWFYLFVDPLRQVPWLRSGIRGVKALLGWRK